MGQQQLLLIVLGFILVGAALIVGINLFTASRVQTNRDAVVSDLQRLGTLARAHYGRPVANGGGGNLFANFIIPTELAQNENGMFEHTQTGHDPDHIHFTGTGIETGDDESTPIRYEIRITPSEMKLSKKN